MGKEHTCGTCSYWDHTKKRNCSNPETPVYYADCLYPMGELVLPNCVTFEETSAVSGAGCPCFVLLEIQSAPTPTHAGYRLKPDDPTMDYRFGLEGHQYMSGFSNLLGRWIPVDESLPEEAVWVLAWERCSENPFVGCRYLGRWTVSHEHVEAEGGWNGAIVVDDLSKPCSVTHWMPLPAPPAL